jgi:[NiFe] hydrogenase assembly HybE family chaperone
MNARFEGSYAGDATRLGDGAILECKICWWSYDPALGDEMRQIAPDTPFSQLPHDWCCPSCDAPKANFMVVDDGLGEAIPAADAPPQAGGMYIQTKAQALLKAFRDIHNTKMADTHFINRSVHVETIGFRALGKRVVGVLITPWCMNLVIMPAEDEDWNSFRIGEKRTFDFASGAYEFIFNCRENLGGYFACSLFSPMDEFSSQLQATDTARSIMIALFDEAHQEAGDRAAEIRAAREAQLAKDTAETLAAEAPDSAAQPPVTEPRETPELSRRFVLTAGLSRKDEA